MYKYLSHYIENKKHTIRNLNVRLSIFSKTIYIDYEFIIQLFRYGIVGILNTIVGLGSAFIFYNIVNLDYIVSNIFGYFLGLVNSFIWNKYYTFKSRQKIRREIFRFLIAFAVSYSLNLLSVVILVKLFNFNVNLAYIAGMIVYTSTNFIGNKFFTFK